MDSNHGSSEASHLAEHLEHILPKLMQRLFHGADDPFSKLPIGQLRILRTLMVQPRTHSELSVLFGVSPGAVSQMIRRLRANNMIQEVTDPSDRRVKRISLTPSAAEQLTERSRSRAAVAEQTLAQIPNEVLEQFVDSVHKIISASRPTASQNAKDFAPPSADPDDEAG